MSTIVISPGHGLNKKNKYSRPLININNNKIEIIDNMKPSKKDSLPGYYREDLGTLVLAKEIREELKCKHNVLLTREDKRNAALWLSKDSTNKWKKTFWSQSKWITNFTNNNNADIFISLHTNAGGGTGCVSFWESAPNGIIFSEILTKKIHEQTGLPIRKIDKHRYSVLRNNCEGSSILLEVLFHDDIDDIQFMINDEKRKILVKAISQGIDDYSKTI
jgi:N-acetylmuramoyl-L-alanine amidase